MRQSKFFKTITKVVACSFLLQATGLQLPVQEAVAAALPAPTAISALPIGPRPDLTKPTTVYNLGGTLSNIAGKGKQPNPTGKSVAKPPQYTGSPSPYHQGNLRSVTPEQSAIDLASRKPVVASIPSADAQAKTASNIKSLAAIASNTVPAPASVDELVRALKSDPDLIYQYVYNNVDYIPMFGEVKGPVGAIIDGAGTDFDQSALLVTLLTKAGYTANFQYGQITITPAQATNWLGVSATDCGIADYFLTQAAIPHTVACGTGNILTSITMSHVWVNVVIGGTTYAWDPSFKTYTINPGQSNVASLLGYVQSTFITNSEAGGTVNANYVQNLSPQSQLQTLAGNLVAWIKANKPGATIDDILGGKTIQQVTAANRVTHLAYEKTGDSPTTWTGDIPASYKISIEIQFPGMDYTLTSDQYFGHRLDMTYDARGFAYLMLDDQVLASSYIGSQGDYTSINFIFTYNAYSDPSINHTATAPVFNSAVSNFALAFGPTSRNNAEVHRAKLQQNMQQYGRRDDFEPVTGESEAVLGQTWAAETTKVMDILERLNHARVFYQSRLAIITQWDTPGISIFDDYRTFASQDATYTPAYNETQKLYAMGNLTNGQIEAAAIRQVSGVDAVSVPVLFTIANAAGTKIYHGNSSNWSSAVVPNLTGYTSDQITSFYNNYITAGDDIVLPANGAINQNNWTGYGLIMYGTGNNCCYYDYMGTLHGGSGTEFIGGDQVSENTQYNQPDEDDSASPDKESSEPIDLANGNYLYDHTDLVIGSQSYPYSLNFTRSYNSGNRYTPSPVGLGWTHNFATTAQVNSDGFLALGEYSVIDASASIAALYVANDLATANTPFESFDQVVLTELSLGWMYQQITGNTVVLTFSDHSEVFVKLADGTYSAGPNNAAKLTLSAGTYTYTTPQQIKITFNALGQIATQSWPNGMVVTFSYNTSNQLTSVTNGLNRTLTFGYTNGYITSVSDGTGRSVYFGYDQNGSLSQFQDALSQITTFQYDQPGRLFQIFRPGNPTTFVVRNTYDTLGRVASQTNANNQTWNYFFAGSRSEEVDPLSNRSVLYYNNHARATREINALSQETDTTYDGMNRVSSITLPEGNQTQYTYDTNNNVLTKVFVPKAASGLTNITNTYTYDATYNKIHTFKDGRNNTTTYNYDPATGNLLNIQYPVVASQTPTRVYTYNTRGQVLTYTDETSIVTKNTYDGTTEKLLTSVLDFGTTPHLNLTTTYGYDAVGNVNSVTDPKTNQTLISFDSLRRKTQITAPSPFNYVTKYTYDGNNNTTSVQRQTGIVTTPWQTMSYTYSLTDKLKTTTDPLGNTIVNTYDNRDRLASVTDADNRTTTYAYDALSRLYTVTDPTSTVQQTKTYTTNGLLYQLKDSRNNVTTYSYDGFDRLNKTTYPDTTYEQNSSYDANGNVLTARTRSGNTYTNTYDALNRLATKLPTGEGQVTYTYDLASRLKIVGKPVVTGDPSTGNFTFTYDTAGRLLNEATPDSKQTQYGRDANGNLTKLTYPDGYYVTRGYDQLNRLTDLYLNGSGTSAAHFGYDQLSRTQALTYNNGASVGYTYQLNNDLTQLTQSFVGSSVTYTYGFNHSHQATSQTVSDSTYLWRPAASASTTYAAANTTNQYPTVGGASYTYDGNGNLKTDGTWTYTYDTENQLLTAVKTGVSASYVYDPLHRQAQKTVGSTKTRFIYGGVKRLADYDGTANTLQNRYVYGDKADQPVIQVTSGGVITYFHQDRANSVISVSAATGAANSKYAFGPYGESSSLIATGFGFTGQRYDSETGLYYFKRRYYSPTLGRFLQTDPVWYWSDLNLYTYVKNDPLNLRDSSGLSSDQDKDLIANADQKGPLKGTVEQNEGSDEMQTMIDRMKSVDTNAQNKNTEGAQTDPDPNNGKPNQSGNETLGNGQYKGGDATNSQNNGLPTNDGGQGQPPDGFNNWKSPDGTIYNPAGGVLSVPSGSGKGAT